MFFVVLDSQFGFDIHHVSRDEQETRRKKSKEEAEKKLASSCQISCIVWCLPRTYRLLLL
jgi:hypothetical protein